MQIRSTPFLKFDRQFPIYNFFFPLSGATVENPDLREVYSQHDIDPITDRSLYFHFPFCETVCSFCPFTRGLYRSDEQIEEYLRALISEIKLKARNINLRSIPIRAIFVGGGTPSLLSSDQIRRFCNAISENFDLTKLEEFSFEIEVKSITPEKVAAMRDGGVTHPRFGLQTFDAKWRQMFNLTATLEDVYKAVNLLVASFPRQSFDILYGMNGQDESQLVRDLELAVSLGTSNIDIYPIDNAMTQVTLHRQIDKDAPYRTSATRKFAMNILVDAVMRQSGFMPHNGHGYFRTPSTPEVLTKNYSFVYHQSVYGYQNWDLLGFGTNAISSTRGYTLTNVSNRNVYMRSLLDGSLPLEARKHSISSDFSRPIVLRLPYHGYIEKSLLNLNQAAPDALAKLNEAIDQQLVIETPTSYNLTKLGWLWYVNLMYYLMPKADQMAMNQVLASRLRSGKRTIRREEVLYTSAAYV